MMAATADANTNLVSNLYADVLGRIPTAPEVSYWDNQLAGGQSIDSVVVGFVLSTEHRRNVVDGLYEQYLNRPAEPEGEGYWVNVLGQGVSEFQLLALLVGSQEYYNKHGGDDAGFVRGLYQDVLGRGNPNPDEVAYWTGVMSTGASRDSVALGFINSPEFIGVGVDGMYRDFLRRDADAAGRSYWVGLFQQGATTLQIQRFLLDSSEYASLAQKSVEPGSQLDLLGGPINPADDITIEFADQQGFRVDVAPLSVAANYVSVVVPPLIDPATGQFAAGTVNVQVLDNSVSVRPAMIGAIQIQDMPHSSAPAGTLTAAYVKGALAAVEQVQNNLSPSFATPALLADLAAEHNYLALTDSELAQILSGQTQSVALGTVAGQPVTMTPANLQLADDYLTAALDGVRTSPMPNGTDTGQQLAATAEANPTVQNFTNLLLGQVSSSNSATLLPANSTNAATLPQAQASTTVSPTDILSTISGHLFWWGAALEGAAVAVGVGIPPSLATPLPWALFGAGATIQIVSVMNNPANADKLASIRQLVDSSLHYGQQKLDNLAGQVSGALHDALATHSSTLDDVQMAGPAGQIVVTGPDNSTLHEATYDMAHFSVALSKKPQGVVDVYVNNSDPNHAGLTPTMIKFDQNDWWQPHPVTVQARDNHVADGDHIAAITFSAQSSKPDYQGVVPSPYERDITIINDNKANVIVEPTSGLLTSEDGGSSTFNVRLTSQPLAQVRFALVSTDTKEGDVTQGTGILDATNWQSGVNFTVVGKDDGVRDGIVPYLIMVGVTKSQDPAYNGIKPPDVSVTHIDNGQPTPTPDTTGHWTGTFTETNPLETISGNMTLDLKANPQYTTVVTGSMTLTEAGGSSFMSDVNGTVSGSRMVLNVSPLTPGFVIQQFIGTVTQDAGGLKIDGVPPGGGIDFVDSSGGQTTGEFHIKNH